MLLVSIEEAVVSVVPPGVMDEWSWLLVGWMAGWGCAVMGKVVGRSEGPC